MDQPFLGTEALAAGTVTRRGLASRYSVVYRNVYLADGAEMTAAKRALAAWLWSGRRSTLTGLSASAVYGTPWIDPEAPAELHRRNGKPTSGILVHRDELRVEEIRRFSGLPVTTPARTAFDLGRRPGRDEAVVQVDALSQATRVRADDIAPLLELHPGVRGLVQLREVLHLMDGGAESPQETRTPPRARRRRTAEAADADPGARNLRDQALCSNRHGLHTVPGRDRVRGCPALDRSSGTGERHRPVRRAGGPGLAHHSRQL